MKRSHCGSLFPVGRKRHVCVRERERDRERQRQRERQRDKETERDRDREGGCLITSTLSALIRAVGPVDIRPTC